MINRANFYFRAGTCDENVFRSVVGLNEYQLPDALPADKLILDIGAHIGSFTQACLERGARRIVACEPEPENYQRCRKHLAEAIKNGFVTVLPVAVVAQAPPAGLLWLSDYEVMPHEINTGAASHFATTTKKARQLVPVIELQGLMDLLTEGSQFREVAWLKLDCEGAEWNILATLRLAEVQNICGEYHPLAGFTPEALQVWLEERGFNTRRQPYGDSGLGLFWGKKSSQ